MAAVWAAGPLPIMQRRVFRVWRSSILAAVVVKDEGFVVAAEAAAVEDEMAATVRRFLAL